MSRGKRIVTEAYSKHALQWAKHAKSGENVAQEYLEKPAMYAKLPDLNNKNVLCIGCGTGDECKYLKTLNAYNVVGIDLSEELIDYAKQSYPELPFEVMDMENLNFDLESFDFVYSSLALHYLDSWQKTLSSIDRILKKNGRFLFSTHHPVTWGAKRTRTTKERTSLLGYEKNKDLNKSKIYGDYLNPRSINDVWFGDFEVSYFHRSLQDMMNDILNSNLELVDFLEPKAIDKCKNINPLFWEVHQKIPTFIIFELQKKVG